MSMYATLMHRVHVIRYDAMFAATVFAYDATRRLHGCEYAADGDRQWHDLTRKRLRIITSRNRVPPASAPTQTAAAPPKAQGLKQQPEDSNEHENALLAVLPPGVKPPPSIFGNRPLSSKSRPLSSKGRPGSAKRTSGVSSKDAAALLKGSPYNHGH